MGLMSLELNSKYILFENYIGVSKLCCPLCDQVLSKLGYYYRGSHGHMKPSITQWKVPNDLDPESQSCLFNFLNAYFKTLDIPVINSFLNNRDQFCIEDLQSNIRSTEVISKIDNLLFSKRFQTIDNIKQFKNEEIKKYKLFEFEWILDIYTYLESIIN